jgi:hypothetical protein
MTLTRAQRGILRYAKICAREMSGGTVGALSGIIGELTACDGRRADWRPNDGFDSIARSGRRIQIKTRRRRRDRDKSPRMGVFKPTKNGAYQFCTGWYVELDENFNLVGIWQASKKTILKLQKNTNKGLSIGKFKKEVKPIVS